jgi:hypothetical protein
MRNKQELAHMIALVITGGQTGADQSGWRAAKAAGIACGGWMPPNFATADGNRPEFAEAYGAKALDIRDYADLFGVVDWKAAYRDRTFLNAGMSDACVWFGNPYSPGGYCTQRACQKANIDYYVVTRPDYHGDEDMPPLHDWIRECTAADEVRTLMIAGNRESKAPGIGAFVERYLSEVFRLLREAGEPVSLGWPPAPPPSASPAAPPHPEDDEERL